MANLSKPLNQGFAAPSIVANYGPYASVAAAHAALAEDELNVVGMTVGIIEANNTIVEYWYQGGTTQSNLVPKKPTNDVTPTEDSENSVTSGGLYSEFVGLGKDVNLLSQVGGVEVSANNLVTPSSYNAGDIFYVNLEGEGDNFSRFVDGVKYYIAKANGEAGASLDSNLFDNTYSGAEAVRLSQSYKNVTVDAYTKSESDGRYQQKEQGKGLSTNDFNNTYKEKLDNLDTNFAAKADKDTDAVVGNFASFDSNGNPVDSNMKPGDFDVAGAAADVKSELIGDAASDYNTLGKLEDKIQAEASRAAAVEAAKADKENTLAGYGITDAYTKSETYTKNEVNGLVSTPHQNYVTVAATSQTASANDVLPAVAQAAADTIYRVSNWDGSANSGVGAFNVAKYSEYALDGSANPVYICLSVKSQVNEVFDISEYHSGQVYANLTEALGTNGANVPSDLRRGGMSVKFIKTISPALYNVVKGTSTTIPAGGTVLQSAPSIDTGNYTAAQLTDFSTAAPLPATTSAAAVVYYVATTVDEITTYTTWSITMVQSSDNKYVQCRYMSSSTAVANFTKVANWQGIDDEPTAGSNNLVKSGGVLGALNNGYFLGKGTIFNFTKVLIFLPEHKYRIFTNEWDTSYYSGSGALLRISAYKNEQELSQILINITYVEKAPKYVDIITPSDFDYIAIGGRAASNEQAKYYIVDLETSENATKSANDYTDEQIAELYNKQNYEDDKALNVYGVIQESTGFFVSDKIPVSNGDIITWSYSDNNTNKMYLEAYNSSDEPISTGYLNSVSSGVRTLTLAREGAAYVIATFEKKEGYTPYINVNSVRVWDKIEDSKISALEKKVATYDSTIESLENGQTGLQTQINELDKDINGYGTVILDSAYNTNLKVAVDADGWSRNIDYIPVNLNDILVCKFGVSSSVGNLGLLIYDENKVCVSLRSATQDSRNVVINDASWKYVRMSFRTIIEDGNNTPNTTPLKINGVSAFDVIPWHDGIKEDLSSLENRVAALEPSTEPSYGFIGTNYPEQIKDIINVLSWKFQNRFHFLHISDNHNHSFGHTEEFVDLCDAKFLVNTGDLVPNYFSEGAANTLALAQTPTKPVYLVLGNHDYGGGTATKQAVFEYFIQAMNSHNNLSLTKTYWSIDYTTEGIKCIFLDQNDGWTDAELADTAITTLTALAVSSKMSAEQINWFVAELQDAASRDLHVCCFIHNEVDILNDDNLLLGWRNSQTTHIATEAFLADIVDAFVEGGNVTFSHNGNSYNFSFAQAGHFVAWFTGHQHDDNVGWLKNHPNQFNVTVPRPFQEPSQKICTMYDSDSNSVHFNYVTIDKSLKMLSVYRVGQQKTVFATERKSFNVLYK